MYNSPNGPRAKELLGECTGSAPPPSSPSVFASVNTGRALVVQSQVSRVQHRPGFDVVSSVLQGLPGGDLWHSLPPLVPAKRSYILSFQVRLG